MSRLHIRTFVTGCFQQNTYLVRDGASGATAVVDAGDGIDELLHEPGVLEDGRLDLVLMTHFHLDHAWSLAALQRAFPEASVCAHRDEQPLIERLSQQGAMFGLPFELEQPQPPDLWVEDGREIAFGGLTIRAIHTAGHSPGGVCWLVDGSDCFCGDMVFAGSVGRTDLPGGDREKMAASLARLMELPDDVVLWSGHGPSTTVGKERSTNPFLVGLKEGGLYL